MGTYSILFLAIFLSAFFFDVLLEILNLRRSKQSMSKEVQEELGNFYSKEHYISSQEYLGEKARFDILVKVLFSAFFALFFIYSGFEKVDLFSRSLAVDLGLGMVGTGLIFTGSLFFISKIISLPFSLYETFVIESKFGFNKTDPWTFFADLLKSSLLAVLLGAPILSIVFVFFESFEKWAWFYSWMTVLMFELLILFFAPVFILPLFNRYSLLSEGVLREKIEELAKKLKFEISEIYTMDGSRRSTKGNAFFIGFGKNKRIVLFDTLLEKHTDEEVLAILAHEIGHFQKKHIFKAMLSSVFLTGVLFYSFSLLINHPFLFEGFKMSQMSVYASLILVGLLYSPCSRVLSVFTNILSRKNEFEADAFAAQEANAAEDLIRALKKLSADHLSNLNPHPLKVFVEYTHPPLLERVKALRLAVKIPQ